MAENKKDSASLEGKNVEIFLKTPLFRFRYIDDGKERELMENAVRISGKVIREKGSGLVVQVDVLSNMKSKQETLPFEAIFLPYSKIDFMVLE